MNMSNEFLRLMAAHQDLALATSVDNTPHVCIVNFVYAEEKKLVYFATFPDNAKVGEIDANHTVSFTTIPHDGGTAHVRAVGTAAKSKRSIFDLADTFTAKIPGYDETIAAVGDALIVYEITFPIATVTVDMEHTETVEI